MVGVLPIVGKMQFPFSVMKRTGLDQRHRSKNSEIASKRGNTLIGTFRKIYGPAFAHDCDDREKLSDVLKRIDGHSLAQLVHDLQTGELDAKIMKVANPEWIAGRLRPSKR
jgi:hypothetical protein